MRRRGRPGRPAVARGQRARGERDVATARSRTATSVPTSTRTMWCRKALPRTRHPQQVAVALELDRAQLAHRAAALGQLAAERDEVVLAQQRRGRRGEARVVERPRRRARRARATARRALRAVEDQVVVDPLARVEAGREAVGDELRLAHDDVGGRLALSASTSRSTGNARSARNETTCPVACTPASVRPAAVTLTGAPNSRASAGFERAGDRAQRRLVLEPVERGPVVLDDEAIRRHALGFTITGSRPPCRPAFRPAPGPRRRRRGGAPR